MSFVPPSHSVATPPPDNADAPKPVSHPSDGEDFPIVVHCHLSWDWVWQRPQQFLSRFSQKHRVLFVETHAPDPALVTPLAQFRRLETYPKVTILKVQFPTHRWSDGDYVDQERRRLVQAAIRGPLAGQFEAPVQWFYDPMAVTAFAGHLNERAIVYDCMDELSKFRGAPPQIVERETELLRRADVVFTGGRKMYEAKSQHHANCHFYGCGVDNDHFGRARDAATAVPGDLAGLPKPVLGYFGVVDERMDYELLAKLADANPNGSVVIVGPTAKVDANTFPRRPNLHWLGGRQYEELPAYTKGFDVCLMPFAMNEATEFINPTKALEYMATGRMIVSSAVPDVVRNFGTVVRVAQNHEEFSRLCAACARQPDSALIEAGLAMARENSWESIVAKMERHIREALEQRQASTALASRIVLAAESHKHQGKGNGHGSRESLAAGNSPRETKANGKGTPERVLAGNGSRDGLAGENGHREGHANGHGQKPGNGHVNHLGEHGRDGAVPAFPHLAPIKVFDYLIVGAGYAGSVIAERLARGLGKQVLIVDRRAHIGGNAYDHYDAAGILVHKYGPHIFHTNSKEVFDYLSRFTPWRNYQHRVQAHVDGQLVPIPINLDTINRLYGLNLNAFQVDEFLASRAEKREAIRTSEDVVVSRVGRDLYEKLFRNYTRKAWGLDPSELDASVTSRVPTRTNRDDRYFTDVYQAMPKHGFTPMFGNMLDHPNIKVMLNTDYREVKEAVRCREVVFTGPIDEFFDYRYGKLPYRCLSFQHETLNQPVFQPVAVVNYPNEYAFTRITEFKHLTGQEHPKTSIVYEYPQATGDEYYPIPRPENSELYQQYQALANATPGVHFVGRLATYRYYNMDQVTAQALTTFARMTGANREEALAMRESARATFSFSEGKSSRGAREVTSAIS